MTVLQLVANAESKIHKMSVRPIVVIHGAPTASGIASAMAFCSMSSPDPSNTLNRGKAPVTDTAILKIESLTQSQNAVTRRGIFNDVCKTLTPTPQHSIKQQSL